MRPTCLVLFRLYHSKRWTEIDGRQQSVQYMKGTTIMYYYFHSIQCRSLELNASLNRWIRIAGLFPFSYTKLRSIWTDDDWVRYANDVKWECIEINLCLLYNLIISLVTLDRYSAHSVQYTVSKWNSCAMYTFAKVLHLTLSLFCFIQIWKKQKISQCPHDSRFSLIKNRNEFFLLESVGNIFPFPF